MARTVHRRRRGLRGLGATDCTKCDSLFGSVDWATCYANCAAGSTGPAAKSPTCQNNCAKQDSTGGPVYMQCLANCGLTGGGGGTTQPTSGGGGGIMDIFTGIFGKNTDSTVPQAQPPDGGSITDWFTNLLGGGGGGAQPTTPQIVTPALSNCNSDCNKRFAQFSTDWVRCNAGCVAGNLPGTQPGTTQPGGGGGGLTDLFTGFANLFKNIGGGAANIVPGVGPGPDGGYVPGTVQPVKAGMGVAGWAIIIGAVGVGGYLLLKKKKAKPGEKKEGVQANRRPGRRARYRIRVPRTHIVRGHRVRYTPKQRVKLQRAAMRRKYGA